ncbi:DUF4166 domain-containing protein [Lysobacter cavernae]|uniref:DUF4166 domain-containing protein n=1 Tax=Lysobacter cavernae TaxID=1685901 RepID=A0ABV7RS64_9GAMM
MAAAPPPTLYRQLLGAAFERLPPSVQRLHARDGQWRYHGKVEVERGTGLLARLCAWATRLPRAGRGPIKVEIAADRGRERWARVFAGRAMRSRLWGREGLLCERLGPVLFGFHLDVETRPGEGHAVVWRLAQVRVLGVPLPAAWFEQVQAHEYARDHRYRFDVTAALPWVGLLVHYRGWLDVD